MGKKRAKSVFADEASADALEQTIEQSIARVQAIAAAYVDGTLDPSQYDQAVKSLNFAMGKLDEAQNLVEDSLTGKEDFQEIMNEESQASVMMHNIVLTRMSASVCAKSIQGDMEDNMTLDDALDVPEDEIDDADSVEEPAVALKKEEASMSKANDDEITPAPVAVPEVAPVVAKPTEDNIDDQVAVSTNGEGMVEDEGEDDEIEEDEVPNDDTVVPEGSVASALQHTSMADLSAKVRKTLLS